MHLVEHSADPWSPVWLVRGSTSTVARAFNGRSVQTPGRLLALERREGARQARDHRQDRQNVGEFELVDRAVADIGARRAAGAEAPDPARRSRLDRGRTARAEPIEAGRADEGRRIG
ncbi:hypothetical protein [Salinarimonas ramus]|uniref:hypothetical protein n=1 Tax=Salinarimonas ramus TaxID=690164 RepID=UPI0016693E0A|nr:hypothetical protein [Salinarimonas ramus]